MSAHVLTFNLNNGTRVLASDRTETGEPDPVRYVTRQAADRRVAELVAAGINARVYAPASSRVTYVEILPAPTSEAVTAIDDMRYYVPALGCDCGELLCSGVHVSGAVLRVICSWCERELRAGAEPASHGICPECKDRVLGEAGLA